MSYSFHDNLLAYMYYLMEDFYMKKTLVFSTALMLGATAYAGVDFSGQGRIRHEMIDNKDFTDTTLDKRSFTGSRFRLNVTAKKNDDSKFSVFMQPQFNKTYGETNSTNLSDDPVNMHQAYINYNAGEYFNLTIGRLEFNLGDQLLVGGVGWSNNGRASDGFALTSKCLISGTNTFFGIKAVESDATAHGTGDYDIYGLYHSDSLGKFAKNFDLYVIGANDHRNANESLETTLYTFGTRIKNKMNNVDYRVELTSQKGKAAGTDTQGNQFDIEAGYTVDKIKTRLAVEYFQASNKFDQLIPTGHKWLGFADMFKRQNIKGLALHTSSALTKKLNVKVDYHMFSRTDVGTTAYSFGGGAYGTVGDESAIANELDLTVGYKLEEGLGLAAGYSMVMPGKYLEDNGMKDTMTFSYLQLTANF